MNIYFKVKIFLNIAKKHQPIKRTCLSYSDIKQSHGCHLALRLTHEYLLLIWNAVKFIKKIPIRMVYQVISKNINRVLYTDSF